MPKKENLEGIKMFAFHPKELNIKGFFFNCSSFLYSYVRTHVSTQLFANQARLNMLKQNCHILISLVTVFWGSPLFLKLNKTNKTKQTAMSLEAFQVQTHFCFIFQNYYLMYMINHFLCRVSIVAQWCLIWVGTMRLWVQSLASLSGLRIWCCRELWCRSHVQLRPGIAVAVRRLVATAPIGPLAWEPPDAAGVALKRQKTKKKLKPLLKLLNKKCESWQKLWHQLTSRHI